MLQQEFNELNHYSFVFMDSLNEAFLNDLEVRFENQETLVLDNYHELLIFLNLYSSSLLDSVFPEVEDAVSGWCLSTIPLSKNQEEFESFYQNWLNKTGRDNNMDEYGQLLCLNSFFGKVPKASLVVVLHEAT